MSRRGVRSQGARGGLALVAGTVLAIASLAACATGGSPNTTDEANDPDAPLPLIDAGTDAGPDACVARAEACNGADDDCDGDSDEDFATLGEACSAGVGACLRLGALACNDAGDGVACDAEAGTATDELCNDVDDDCDSSTDEGFALGVACDGVDADECAEGVIVCGAGGAAVCADATGDTLETCNGADDDCDQATDEGYGLGGACDGSDGDVCVEGVVVCDGGGGATCSDASSTTVESCNHLDDDCDTSTDEGYAVGQACSAGVGACNRAGILDCTGDGTGVACTATAGTPTPEFCGDGVDQDCNGADVTCPINDLPSGAVNISAGGTFTVDLATANDNHAPACGSTGGRDVYYTFTLPAAEVVYADTFGSNYDTTLALYAGACSALGAAQTCSDDTCSVTQSQLARSLAAGQYCLVVDQWSSGSTNGATVLTFTRGGRSGTELPSGTTSRNGNSCDGVNTTTGTCQTNSTADDVGYFFTSCPAASRTLSANVCAGTSFDSVLYLRRSGQGTDLACSDDAASCGSGLQSSFTGATATGAGLNWLIVDGYQTSCGAFTLATTLN
jgi:hypothetical protein